MRLDLFTVVFLLGAINGFIIAFYLLFFSKDDKRQTKYFLAFLVLALSYDMLETVFSSQQIKIYITDIIGFSWVFTLGPNIYFSIKTSFRREVIPLKIVFYNYLPAIIDLVISIILFSLRESPFVSPFFASEEYYRLNQIHIFISRLLNVLSFWIYLVLAFRECRKMTNEAFQSELTISINELAIINKWSISFLYICLTIGTVWTITIIAVYALNRYSILYFYYPIEFLLAIASYWIGYTMYHQVKTIYLSKPRQLQILKENPSKYYNKTNSEETKRYEEILFKSMKEDKLYLDPELTVARLSNFTKIPAKKISAVLNQHSKIGFNDFVNEFRVEEVKQRLLNPKNKNLTILAIAFDSGFNSVTTFQRVFKNKTGLTPKEFLSQNKK